VNKIIKIPSFQLLSTQVVKSKIDPYKLCEWCVECVSVVNLKVCQICKWNVDVSLLKTSVKYF
jgi:hypothetical protein